MSNLDGLGLATSGTVKQTIGGWMAGFGIFISVMLFVSIWGIPLIPLYWMLTSKLCK